MEREANYLAVGSFVLLVLVMGFLFVYWYSASIEHRFYVRYEIYFDGSVSGLTEGGPVRYLGVDVGRVVRIRIDPRAANRVQVIADIDATTPISDRTLAQLSLQGITGLLYIDLQQQRPDDNGRRVLAAVPSEHYQVIRSAHSDFDLFLSSLPELAVRLNELVDRTARVLSDSNIASLDRLLNNIDKVAAELPHSVGNADGLVTDLRSAINDAHNEINDIHAATKTVSVDFVAAIQKLRATSDNLERATGSVDAFVAENRDQLNGFVRGGLPQLELLLRDSRAAAQEIRDLSRSLRDNPSQLIYQPAVNGVMIPP
ncbi:MAG TPA: MlaD family protein [Steroidobacteraceae bacterium]|jgi:phospholipid/cholesterol/gamma-HCH transport system substrate-binding protein|nr:MlaD family protein [Steroidobacteraceae bacterium]